jgi:two-component system, NarL family, nitrate/nitrite response regulator NarL
MNQGLTSRSFSGTSERSPTFPPALNLKELQLQEERPTDLHLPILTREAAPRPISVLIVDHDPLLCALISRSLGEGERFRVVGTAGTREDLLRAMQAHGPDVVTLDLELSGVAASDLLATLMALPQPPAVLILSGNEEEDMQVEVGRMGAQGFLSKAVAIDALPAAIQALARGEVWFTRRVQGRILREHQDLYRRVQAESGPLAQLTAREREVLIGASKGLTNTQIAKQLFVSSHTVKLHMKNLLRKLNMSSRTEAAVLAVREGLLREEQEVT